MNRLTLLGVMTGQGHVLVADDDQGNRILLRDLLEARGHRVTEAVDGRETLQKVAESSPDVVLLDVMMPALDGFEVCRLLKGAPQTAPISIIMVTSLTDRTSRLKGMEAGANDFLTKPIDTQDVILRVRNAVCTKQLFDRLQENYHRLQELETLRDNLTHMIVHDLRSPLMGIMGYLEMLQVEAPQDLGGQTADYVAQALAISQLLHEMISSLLDVSRLEAGEMPLNISRCDLGLLAREAVGMLGHLEGQCRVNVEEPPAAVMAACDPTVIGRIISNLVGNAINFTPEEGEIKVTVESCGPEARVAVTDMGPGIPPEDHARIFEKFGQLEVHRQKRKHSTGLGLTFCKLAVEAHGGRIGVESAVGRGSTFWFTLPTRKK